MSVPNPAAIPPRRPEQSEKPPRERRRVRRRIGPSSRGGDISGQVGAALLAELHAALGRYVVFPSPEVHDAVTAYIAATHAAPAWEHASRLAILSPEKRCGKSRLLDVIEATCHQPLITVNISPAALVRSIGVDPPTLLLDEADTVFGKKAADNHEDLRGIINAGHQRNRPYIRWDATARSTEHCKTFSMAVLAGIGDLPDTIMDRAVIARMRRRAPGEVVAPYRSRRDAPALNDLRLRLGEWIREHIKDLGESYPDMPVEDRAADTWEPLVAVADLARGDWPERIRTACKTMTTDADASDASGSLGLRLLADMRTVFGTATALHTKTVLERLHDLEDGPWGNLYGQPLTSHELSKRLRPYGAAPVDVREEGGPNRKGYRRVDLHEAWSRYLPRDTGDNRDIAGQTRRGSNPVADETATSKPPATGLTCDVAPVADVAATPPETVTEPSCLECGAPNRWLSPTTRLCASCESRKRAAS